MYNNHIKSQYAVYAAERRYNLKGAIFDVDGTLLDSMGVWWDACAAFMESHGVLLSEEKGMQLKEMRLEQSLPMIIGEYNLDITVEDAINEIKAFVDHEYVTSVPLKPYADEYLRRLKSEGVKTAVATSGYPELCKAAFKRLGIYDLIDAYAFSHEVNKGKDNPDIYLLAAERIGCKPCDCVVFEDITAGISGAKKGGFTACAIYDRTNEADTDVLKRHADHYITGWKDML